MMKLFGSDTRSVKMKLNVKVSLVMKLLSAAITFLQVPLTLKCLGEYQNGVWLTISSLLLWIDVFDIGLGNGMRNKLAEAIACNRTDEAKECIASTFIMLVMVIIPAYIVIMLLIQFTDVYALLNIDISIICNLRTILIVAFTLVCSTFILKLIGNFYMGMQMPSVSNVIQTAGLLLALIATYVLYVTGSASLLAIVAVNVGAPLLVYVAVIPYTFLCKYPELRPAVKDIRVSTAAKLAKTGVSFFCIQLSSLFLFASSNALISMFFTPIAVTPFQIAYRYMSLITIIFTIFAMPLWSATTDAYTRGDIAWIHDTDKKVAKFMLMIVALFVVMLFVAPLFYHVWIHDEVMIPSSYTLLLGLYVLTVSYSTRYSCFLNGVGALRLQLIMTFVDALLFVGVTYITSKAYHDMNVFIVIMIATQLPGLIVNRIQFKKILNGDAVGIWKIR